jgi:predicted ferric reductase
MAQNQMGATARDSFAGFKRYFLQNFGGEIAIVLSSTGLGITLGFALHDATYSDMHSTSGIIVSIGRISGLLGTYLVLMSMIVIARVPWIEKSVGFDRLVQLHRKLGPLSLSLITAHVVFITLGYALVDSKSFVSEFLEILTKYSWMYAALVSFLLFVVVGISSANQVRRKLRYETWWKLHLMSYFAVALSFMHQILTGSLFVFNEVAKSWWIFLHLYTAFTLLMWRFIFPIVRSFRHKLTVDHVDLESENVASIYISGKNLEKIHARGGNFFEWRFLSKSLWGQAHPYSLSAAPTDTMLRISVKNLGDHSAALSKVLPGTRVVAEGPYGIFTAARSSGNRVVLIGGGVGIAPLRSILQDFNPDTEIDLIYRVVTAQELILKKEIDSLIAGKRIRVHYLVGEPQEFQMRPEDLLKLVPDMALCNVYLCGPPGLARVVRHSIDAIGVPSSKFHYEAFAFGSD